MPENSPLSPTHLTEAELDALRCQRCGQRSDWHSYDDGACSDDDGPHPYSLAHEAAWNEAHDGQL